MFDMSIKTIRFLLVKRSCNNENIFEFDCLKEIDNFENFAIFFTLVTIKLSLYADIAKKNIRYSKFL